MHPDSVTAKWSQHGPSDPDISMSPPHESLDDSLSPTDRSETSYESCSDTSVYSSYSPRRNVPATAARAKRHVNVKNLVAPVETISLPNNASLLINPNEILKLNKCPDRGEYVCPYPNCGYGCVRRYNLKIHYTSHIPLQHAASTTAIETFACFVCGKVMRRRFDMQRHRLCVHNVPVECRDDGADFTGIALPALEGSRRASYGTRARPGRGERSSGRRWSTRTLHERRPVKLERDETHVPLDSENLIHHHHHQQHVEAISDTNDAHMNAHDTETEDESTDSEQTHRVSSTSENESLQSASSSQGSLRDVLALFGDAALTWNHMQLDAAFLNTIRIETYPNLREIQFEFNAQVTVAEVDRMMHVLRTLPREARLGRVSFEGTSSGAHHLLPLFYRDGELRAFGWGMLELEEFGNPRVIWKRMVRM
ncbi:hypothetical protein HDU98_005495 [Podochytrium sp. JEL0797]|nr:hypothetical protein HDU98_005495 [Podochytrium sp. JEL0797]